MKEIQKKYKGDRQKMNEELMKFYKENNINPAASCLPMLAQFPVFISLYFVLRHFAKHPPGGRPLAGSHIVPNIADKASAHWSGYLLLVIYARQPDRLDLLHVDDDGQDAALPDDGRCRSSSSRSSLNFPVGLVIYWVTTNLWTVGQGLVTRRLVPKTPAPQIQRRSSRTPPKDDGDGDGNGAKPEGPRRSRPRGQQQRPRRRSR